jgi:hypothetical protein
VTNLIFSQSNYPLKTTIKGDSVVILTIKQADDINFIFENQKNKIDTLKKQLSSFQSQNQELTSQINSFTSFYDSITKRLDILNHWLYWSAVDGAWIYYSYKDSTIKVVDLLYYHVDLDPYTGDLLFINAPEEYRHKNYTNEQREKKESPPLRWEYRIPERIRPNVTNAP